MTEVAGVRCRSGRSTPGVPHLRDSLPHSFAFIATRDESRAQLASGRRARALQAPSDERQAAGRPLVSFHSSTIIPRLYGTHLQAFPSRNGLGDTCSLSASCLRLRPPACRRRDERRDRSRERGKDERDRRPSSGRERRDGGSSRPSGGLPPRAPSNPLMAEAYRLAKEKQQQREREAQGGAAAAESDDDEPVERPREWPALFRGLLWPCCLQAWSSRAGA